MSRLFGGPTTLEGITFSVGSAAPDNGPITVVLLARPSATPFTAWAIHGNVSGTRLWSILVDTGKLYTENDFGTGGPSHGTGWCWYAYTKASGSNIPRWHMKDITAGSAWVHQNDTFNIGDGSGPINSIVIGNAGSAANTWRGRIAAAATFTSVLNDAAIEAACTLAAADLLAAGPGWMVRLNQASTATSVVDDTGNGGGQSAITGTTVDPDDPPGFDYSLSAPGSTLAAAITLPALTGAAALTAGSAVTSAITLPALQASAVLAARATLASALSLPALQATATLTTGVTLASALSLPALQAASVLAARVAVASAMTLPALDMSAVLSVPVAPAEDTSSPNSPISTISRPVVIATISQTHVISTGARGGA